MGWFDDVVDFVEDAADVVVDVAEDTINGVTDAVQSIPMVGDIADAAAPFAGIVGSAVYGPIGGAVGSAIGSAFSDGGFDFVDAAIGAVGNALPGGFAGMAGDLLGGGSLIDTAGSILAGGGLGDLGGLADAAGGLLGGDLGGLTDVAGGLMGGDLGGLADAAGGLLGGDLGGILGQASSVLGGLGLGDLASAAEGLIGDCTGGGLSDASDWLGNLPDVLGGAGAGDGFELPFGLGTFPSIPDLTGPIGAAGGGWLGQLAEQAGEVAGQLGGTSGGGSWFEQLGIKLEDMVDTTVGEVVPSLTDVLDPVAGMQDAGLPDIDDLIGQLPGLDDTAGSVQEKLQSLVETGNLGDALGNLSSNELTQIVSHLVSPGPSVIDTVTGAAGDAATSGIADAGSDMVGIGADDLGLDAVTSAVTSGEAATEAVGMPTPDAVAAVDDLSIEMPGADLGAPEAPPAVEMPAPAPEPEPESDFSQAIAQADAVEQSFDSMFEGLE